MSSIEINLGATRHTLTREGRHTQDRLEDLSAPAVEARLGT